MQASVDQKDTHHADNGLDFAQRLSALRRRIYSLAYRNLRNRDDAEDITQETFARAWMHAGQFQSARSLDAWVTRIAINLCVDTIRRRQRYRAVSLDTPQSRPLDSEPAGYQVADSTQDPMLRFMEAEIDEHLNRAVHSLPAPYRRCVQLLAQQYSYEEIGDLMGCPMGTVRSRLFRARTLIRQRLQTARID